MNRLVTFFLLCFVAFAAAYSVKERIQGGYNAAPAEFPYQVSLQINGEHVCGGALITSRHVVTAASCVIRILTNPNLLQRTRVLVGTISLRKDGIYYGVSRVSIHPEYKYSTEWASFVNDIAVVHLAGEARNSYWVKPINLPGVTEIPENSELIFTGWGSVAYNSARTVEILHKASLRSISTRDCQNFLPDLLIKPYHLCTSANYYVGTCTTDSGSPLVHRNQLVGISTGVHGCASGKPDVFTKVSFYLKYIWDEVNYVSSA